MIVFYNKKTGEITGVIDGRLHPEEHLHMWIGDKNENERIVVQWYPVSFFTKEGKQVPKGHPKSYSATFEPQHPQKELFSLFDSKQLELYNYKVELNSKQLIKK